MAKDGELTDERRQELMAKVSRRAPTMAVLRPTSFGELAQFAQMAAKSTMVPPQYKSKPEDIMLAVQMGSELGLAPMQSLQNIAVINGRPACWGDAVPALCKQSPLCEDIVERIEGEGDEMVATCIALRYGKAPVERSFSIADAKRAGLFGKQGPWQQYPKRMLQMRARGFACRDAFPDVLRGLITVEEAEDIPQDAADRGPIIDGYAARTDPDTGLAHPTRKPTTAEWLETIGDLLDAAKTGDAVDAIVARPDVQKALDVLRDDHRDRLNKMINEALARTRPDEFTTPTQDEATNE